MKRNLFREIVILLVLALLVPMFSVAEDGGVEPSNDVSEMEEVLELKGVQAPDVEEIGVEEDLTLGGLLNELSEGEQEGSEADPEVDADAQFSEVENVSKKYGVPIKLTLGVKETFALKCTKKQLSYKSSSAKVAKVSKKGVITAVKKGNVTITVYSGKKKLTTCEVTVVAAPKEVSLAVGQAELGLKESLTIIPIISDDTHASFTYGSNNTKIATVNSKGVVTAKKMGSTMITVKTHNGKKAILELTVRKAPKTVALEPGSLELEVGQTAALSAVLPDKTVSFKLTWSSSKKSVATVDENGVVTAVSRGTAYIIVKTFNKKEAVCTVTVTEPTPTEAPTSEPTPALTENPTPEPTAVQTETPSIAPTVTPALTATPTPTPDITPVPSATPTPKPEKTTDPTDGDDSIDMFEYLCKDGAKVAKELGFEKTDEYVYEDTYYKDGVSFSVYTGEGSSKGKITCIRFDNAPKTYNICGVYCGMTLSEEESVLNAAGWERYPSYDEDGCMNFVRERLGREDWLNWIQVYYKDVKVDKIRLWVIIQSCHRGLPQSGLSASQLP